MQTFMPYSSFEESAKALDYRRLGKQRVEAWQILNTLTGQSKGWANHPAVRMWQGHEASLCAYGMVMCREWKSRGYKDSLLDRFVQAYLALDVNIVLPAWLGDESLHASHRSNLLRKDEAYYRQHGWTEPTDLAYVWPK